MEYDSCSLNHSLKPFLLVELSKFKIINNKYMELYCGY